MDPHKPTRTLTWPQAFVWLMFFATLNHILYWLLSS